MKRRSFLVATTGAAVTVGLTRWGTSPTLAHGAPAKEPQIPLIDNRADLVTVAATVPALTLDGTLRDPRWGDPHWTSFTTLYDLAEVPETALHVVHDATALYVGVRVSGAAAATVSHVSLLARPGDGGEYRSVTVELRAVRPTARFSWGGASEPFADPTTSFRVADDAATCEIAVPLSELGITGDPAARTVAINVVVDHEDMTRGTATATPTRNADNMFQGGSSSSLLTEVVDQDRATLIHLGGIAPLAVGRTAPELLRTIEVGLGYVDFTHKTLTIPLPTSTVADTITVDWRAPGDDWTSLDALPAKKTRAGVTTGFEHPKPIPHGQYQLRIRVRSRSGRDQVVVATFDRQDLITAGDRLPINRPHPIQGDTAVTTAPASPAVAALLTLVPDRTGFTFCGVPDNPGLHPNATFTWSPDQPDRIVAKSTGTAYPNDEFPEDQELVVTNALGAAVSYPYHQDADGKRYFLSGHLWYHQREHVYRQLVALAEDDPLGAARVLHRFSEVYPGWVATNEYPWLNRPVAPAATPRNFWWGGVWSRWSTSNLGPMERIGNAFAAIARTDAFEVLSAEVGEDVRARIVEQMIEPSVEWMHTFPLRYHNNDYSSHVGLASLSKALGDSRFVHETVEYSKEYLRRGFLYDGFWKETTLSYHNQSVNGLFRIAAAAQGWSDAEDYVSPRDGSRYANLDLRTEMAVLGGSARIPNVLVYPDNKLFPMADTWASSTAADPDHGAGSVVFGGGGVARLSRGAVASTGPFGVVQQFPDLELTENTVEVKLFAASGTLQLEAALAGESMTFAFTVDRADSYDVDLLPFHAGTYGRYEISVDDAVLGEHDFYDTTSGVADFLTLGRVALAAGDHRITFLGLGKHDSSGGFKMGVVSLALLDEAARQERDVAEPPETANPSQAYLLLTPKYGHNQWDPLSLAVYAEGQELLPDLGYSHTKYRRWTCSNLAHNTVTVDSADMTSDGRDGGSLEIFDTGDPAVQVMRAEFGSAYPQTSRFQRETWAIEHPDTERHTGYVLDLFRVVGGERHEYTLNGDANRDAEMITTTEVAEYGPYLLPEGVQVTEPETELDFGDAEGHYYGYLYVREVKRAALTDGRYEVSLTTTVDGAPGSGAHILGLAGEGTELFLGRAPSLRATRLNGTSGDTNDEAEKWWLPKLVARRDGTDLHSDFVTMVEPVAAGENPRITSITSLAHNGSSDDLAVKVTHADGTVDVIISRLDPEGSVTADGVTLTGKLGFARVREGATVGVHLVGGTRITAPGKDLTGTGAATGVVTGTRRTFTGADVDALITSAAVPDWVAGHTVVVTHPDGKTHPYPIKSVATDGSDTLITLDAVDPGFTIRADDSSAMEFTPFTTWTGATTFRVENSESS